MKRLHGSPVGRRGGRGRDHRGAGDRARERAAPALPTRCRRAMLSRIVRARMEEIFEFAPRARRGERARQVVGQPRRHQRRREPDRRPSPASPGASSTSRSGSPARSRSPAWRKPSRVPNSRPARACSSTRRASTSSPGPRRRRAPPPDPSPTPCPASATGCGSNFWEQTDQTNVGRGGHHDHRLHAGARTGKQNRESRFSVSAVPAVMPSTT